MAYNKIELRKDLRKLKRGLETLSLLMEELFRNASLKVTEINNK